METVTIPQEYGRVKGAEWFQHTLKKPVVLIGAGGIGSWVALLLSRIGCNLHIFDHDSYEVHNLSGQLVSGKYIGTQKSYAVADIINQFSPNTTVTCYNKYLENSITNNVVICGLDNMAARKLAFRNWLSLVEKTSEEKRKFMFFQDGRLNAELLQIINIPGNNPEAIRRYQEEYLFDDEEVVEQDCTFKQTSHCAAMIGSLMTTFFTNWVTNTYGEDSYREVPFFYEFIAPLNMTTNERLVV